jgi:hypothetical protein
VLCILVHSFAFIILNSFAQEQKKTQPKTSPTNYQFGLGPPHPPKASVFSSDLLSLSLSQPSEITKPCKESELHQGDKTRFSGAGLVCGSEGVRTTAGRITSFFVEFTAKKSTFYQFFKLFFLLQIPFLSSLPNGIIP